MKLRTYISTVALLAVVALLTSCAQVQYKRGMKSQQLIEYNDAIEYYEKAANKKRIDSVLVRLGECYYWVNDSRESVQWYDSAAKVFDLSPKHQLYYAEGLRNLERYDQAEEQIEAYLKAQPNDQRAKNFRKDLGRIEEMKKDSFKYEVFPFEALDLGSRSVFSPVPFANGLIVTAEWGEDRFLQKYDWTGNPFLDLVYVQLDERGTPTRIRQFNDKINTRFHEGPAAFSPSQDTMYFSRSDFQEPYAVTRNVLENNIKLYRAVREEGDWKDIAEMSLNREGFSAGHPAVANNGKTLYFISDFESKGGTDLWKSEMGKNGSWSRPVNLSALNTEGNEMFPTIVTDDQGREMLVFSTDGLGGLGGLDLYAVPVGAEQNPEHFSYPINSSFDDFGMMSRNMKNGLISSNRNTPGNRIDRILSFDTLKPKVFVKLTVVDDKTGEPLANTKVNIATKSLSRTQFFQTNLKGEAVAQLQEGNNYWVRAKHPQYFANVNELSLVNHDQAGLIDTLMMTIRLKPIVQNTQRYAIRDIYYDFDKYDIRADAAMVLDSVVTVLRDNPEIEIELASHTDCRGSNAYNRVLARKRANSVVDYLVSKGIDRSRLSAKGFGERELINDCDCDQDKWGTACTPEQHQANRRTEFTVVGIRETAEESGETSMTPEESLPE